jgi:hypothetical protein
MMYRQDNSANPPDLDSLKKYGVTNDMIHDPSCSYNYDPQTGRVSVTSAGQPGFPGASGASSGYNGSPAPAQPTGTTTVSGGGINVRVPTTSGPTGDTGQ